MVLMVLEVILVFLGVVLVVLEVVLQLLLLQLLLLQLRVLLKLGANLKQKQTVCFLHLLDWFGAGFGGLLEPV